jgi:hypothetical protein
MVGEAWFMEDGQVQDLPGAITIPVNLWPEYKAILDNLGLLMEKSGLIDDGSLTGEE